MADGLDAAVATESAPETSATVAVTSSSGGDWRSGLPPDLVADKSLESFKDVGALAKSYVEIRRTVGAPLQPPGADAKPEQLAAYRQRLGVPESPDKYELDLPKPAEGSGFQWDPHWVGRMKEHFHKAHMTPAQIRAASELFHEYMHSMADRTKAAQVQEEQAELAQSVKVLEEKWGPHNGPQWRYHQARAETAVKTLLADASESDRQEVLVLANHPAVAHALSQLADGLLERGFIDGQELPAGVSIAQASAPKQALLAEMAKDPSHPRKNPQHPAR